MRRRSRLPTPIGRVYRRGHRRRNRLSAAGDSTLTREQTTTLALSVGPIGVRYRPTSTSGGYAITVSRRHQGIPGVKRLDLCVYS